MRGREKGKRKGAKGWMDGGGTEGERKGRTAQVEEKKKKRKSERLRRAC